MLSYIFFSCSDLVALSSSTFVVCFSLDFPSLFPSVICYMLFIPFLLVRFLSLCPLSFLILPIFQLSFYLSVLRFQCSYSFPQFLVHDDNTNDSLIEQLLLTYYVFENDGTTCLIKDALLLFQVS